MDASDNSHEIKQQLDVRVAPALDSVADQQDLVEDQSRKPLRAVVAQLGMPDVFLQSEQLLEPTEKRLDRLAPATVQGPPGPAPCTKLARGKGA